MPYNSKRYSKKENRDKLKKQLKNSKVAVVPKPQICPFCGRSVKRVHSSQVFYNNNGNNDGFYYVCSGWPICSAYTKEDPILKKPTSTMADKKTRLKRQEAHYWFDQLHKGYGMTKSEAYEWLADELQIRRANCHIGLFDIKMCNKVISVVKEEIKSPIRTKSFNQHINIYRQLKLEERSIPFKEKYKGRSSSYRKKAQSLT